ncbi:cytochrome d ubiquinol oxidase subunit II [Actinacidiphila epipremni]|uniref:Cytochrome d ubiquinol oxidase subunit II n=1 Tax=Actinacidiphila epipremni TaxID=2053013 RepID=A0ABX0ZZ07_9ACTN|nr:cytochrome d ubiquinol oxidase subunit II [Actinacidiphila epipremni]NJP48122.1 cytochrome d ubiquinol oxidase subunit II [Actinacidiphila epipremni]
MTDTVAVFLFVGVVAYCLLGGADFGAGFWDLVAGGAERGRGPRALIDDSLAPVWEANHTWLIYCLVVLWSAFPRAFAAITTTLYVPLLLAALGIVLRGAGFAFRKASFTTAHRRVYGAVFALSSVLTPYCFGAVAGGIASGRVPTRGYGDAVTSWCNPTSVLGGALAVVVCAFLAGAYLTVAARQRSGRSGLFGYFRRRALAAGLVAGAVSIGGIFVLRADARRLFDHLSGRALPLVVVAAVAGAAAVVLLWSGGTRLLREIAALAVALVVVGWGVSQYPFLLGTHLSLTEAASPGSTLNVVVAVACVAVVLIVPSIVLLFALAGRGSIGADHARAGEAR